MVKCPKCNGTGKHVVKLEVDVEIQCLTCRGKGELTEAHFDAICRGDEWMCSCPNSSGSKYEHDILTDKHRWICNDCGGTTKTG